MEDTQTQSQNEIIDLDINMEDVDLQRPVLKDGTYEATVAFTKKDESKGGHPLLLVGYRLAEPAEDTKGNTVNPGFTLTERVITRPTGKLTQKMINERLGRIHFAATGAKTGRVNTGEWTGKPVRIRVKVREERKDDNTGETYPPSNEISAVYGPTPNV